ncbi:MAG: isocitrate/isopropylmalate dehydrogenase family protein [Polyangiaceae bacterium]
MTHRITLIPGDGIGPEVSRAAKKVIRAAGVDVDWEVQHAGLEVAKLTDTPLPDSVIDSVKHNKVALKGPCGTPIGDGFRSVNVSLRQRLDLYANVRPVRSIPGVEERFDVDITIVRENTEGLYAGLELMILPGIAQSLKLTTAYCSKRIADYAFRYAVKHGRKRVSFAHKANIMKISDGLALDSTREIAKNYPEIELREIIIDAAAMTMVRDPNSLDVIVTENLYGDVLSDLGAGLVGGLGFVPGANIGDEAAIFEAVHGTAPDIAGRGIANPTAIIRSAVMMLEHLQETAAAQRIETALFRQYREGKVLTGDIGGSANTRDFTSELCRLIEEGS